MPSSKLCMFVCVLQHGAKGERLPATKFTQPILSAAWVGNGSIICSLHAVYVLYKGYRIPLEYPPTYPSITPSLYCQYFPIEIRSAPFKTSNRNRQWRNLETFSLIDLFAHVYVLCVCVRVCLPRCLRRLYLYHLLFLTDLKCLGKRFFEAMSLFRAARRHHLSTSSTWPKTPWLKRLQITT